MKRCAGVVVYTIDARGLISGQLDATNNVPMDMKGRLESASLREIPASQDAMRVVLIQRATFEPKHPWIEIVISMSQIHRLLVFSKEG